MNQDENNKKDNENNENDPFNFFQFAGPQENNDDENKKNKTDFGKNVSRGIGYTA